ncbi:MAG TPA: ATP-binding protein [Burkholderiaceae bacterium]|nr:ATP-binding protein [Burkholderiaceae bacterium]
MSARLDTVVPATVARMRPWSERNQEWLVAAIARLRERLAAPREALPEHIEDCLDSHGAPGFEPALMRCAQVFGLSPFERELLLLVAGLELDSGLRAAVAALQGNMPRASFGLALAVLTQPHWDALSPEGPLRYWRLVDLEAGVPLTQAALSIDERVLHFLTGVTARDARLLGVARHVETRALTAAAAAADRALAQHAAQVWSPADERGRIVVLHGEPPDACAQRDVALAAAAMLKRSALWLSAHDLPADPYELSLVARHLDREIALTGAVPVLQVGGAESAALALCAQVRSTVLWLGAPTPALSALPHAPRVLRIELPTADAAGTRAALLARVAASDASSDDSDAGAPLHAALERAAAQFHLGPAALDDIVERLHALPVRERAAAVWPAARTAARGGLDALAQRIVTHADFDDLVLPKAQRAALRDIARQLRHRERVYRQWGFGDRHPRGQGFTALFAGESGTGKTLAAEAIANEAELDLYRVDLATLVSKYIGETEKNLKRLFDAAETSGAVLLFDEADALFGKRSEVKDSHDRYANIEVAYLLQRVEAYRGLAILTTNLKSALDRAFLRRIRFVVTFPFPDAAAREAIWRRQFPPRAPLAADVDFKALARLNLPGGHIRSIALNAAFKAADASGCIDQAVLIDAARAEFAKLERSFNDPGGTA